MQCHEIAKMEQGGMGRDPISTKLSHLQCMIEVAVRGTLDADGGHSCSGVGDGTRNEPGGVFHSTHCRGNNKRPDILGDDSVGGS